MHLCTDGLKLTEIQGPSVRPGTQGEELWGVGHGGCPGSWEQSTPTVIVSVALGAPEALPWAPGGVGGAHLQMGWAQDLPGGSMGGDSPRESFRLCPPFLQLWV